MRLPKRCLGFLLNVLLVASVFSILFMNVWQIKPVQATTIFSDEFESDWTPWTTNSSGTSITISNTRAHTGTYSATWTESPAGWCHKDLGSDYGECYARFYIWFSALGNANSQTDIFELSDSGTAKVGVVTKQYGGVQDFALFDKDFNFYDSTIAISTSQWYCIEIAYKSDASGFYKLWVDGTLKVNQGASNAGEHVSRVVMGELIWGGVTMTGWGDCVVVADAYIGSESAAAPTCSVKSPSSTKNWTSCVISAEFDGQAGSGNISMVFVDTNVSGAWSGNVTLRPIWINSTGCWGNYTMQLPAASGTVVGYRWFGNDTANAWVDSGNQTLTTTTDTIDYTKNAVWIYDQAWVARKQNILTANLSGTVADCAANNISFALIFVGYCNAATNKPNYYHTDAFYTTVINAFHAVGIKCLAWWEDGGGGTMDITPSNRQNIYNNIVAEMYSNDWDGYHDDIEARVGTDQQYIDFLNNATVVLHSMGKLMTAALPFDWQQNTNMKVYMDYIFSCFYSTKSTFEDAQAAAYWQEEFGLYGGDHGASASPLIIGVMHFGGNTYPLCWQLGVASSFMNLYSNRTLVGFCIWMYEYIGLRSDDILQWNYWINSLSTTPAVLHSVDLTTTPANSVPITFQGIPQNSNSSAYTFNISVVVSAPASVQSETLDPLFGTTVHAATGGSYNSYTYTSGPYTLASPTSVSSVYFYSSVAGNLKIAIYNTTTYTISGWFGTNEHPHILQTQSSATACAANAWTLITVSTVTLSAGDYFFSIKSDTNNMLIQNVNASNYAGRGQFIGENYATAFNTTFQQPLGSMGCDFSVFVPKTPNSYTPYTFSEWEDTSTNPSRTITTMTSNLTITAYYSGSTVPSINLIYPTNSTYTSGSGTIPIDFTASGGTIDKYWFNVMNGSSWVYTSNQTFTGYTTKTGFVTGTYTFYGYANNTLGSEGSSSVIFSVAPITVTISNPQNTTYTVSTIPVSLSASGGTIDKIWYNVYNNTAWLYPSDLFYTGSTSMLGFINGTSYTFYAWANNTEGITAQSSIMFTVGIFVVPPATTDYVAVELYAPSNGYTTTSTVISFTFIPYTTTTFDNASLWINETGTWQLASWTTTVTNNTVNSLTYMFLTYGTFVWNIQVWNTTDSAYANANFTLTLIAPTTPVTTGNTFYFCPDTQTINTVTGYKLSETQPNGNASASISASGNLTGYVGYRIFIVYDDGTMSELSIGYVGIAWRSNDTEGLMNATWYCPLTKLDVGFQALRVEMYMQLGSGGWIDKATFISGFLNETEITASTWVFQTCLKHAYTGGSTILTSTWGTATAATLIDNVGVTDPDIYDLLNYQLYTGNFIGFIFMPYTNLVGNLFYGLLLLVFFVPLYNRYKSFSPIIILLILFGGAGGILSLLVPEAGLGISWIFLIVGIGGLIYKVFR